MYGRFPYEAAALTGNDLLAQTAMPIDESGARLSRSAHLFEDVFEGGELSEKITRAAELLLESAGLEEEAFTILSTTV